MVFYHTIVPVVGVRLDELPGVGREEAIVVSKIEPLRVPLGVIRHQPGGDVLSRLVRTPHPLHQVEAASPYWFPHPGGSARRME